MGQAFSAAKPCYRARQLTKRLALSRPMRAYLRPNLISEPSQLCSVPVAGIRVRCQATGAGSSTGSCGPSLSVRLIGDLRSTAPASRHDAWTTTSSIRPVELCPDGTTGTGLLPLAEGSLIVVTKKGAIRTSEGGRSRTSPASCEQHPGGPGPPSSPPEPSSGILLGIAGA